MIVNNFPPEPEINWDDWCKKHHIKLGGSDADENRSDAGRAHQSISGPGMADARHGNGRQTGVCHLQEHAAHRPAQKKALRKHNKT